MDIVWQTPANPPEAKDYIFRNGRRHVRPYYFEFISHVKNRWAGKTIVDLFTEEFKGRPYEYYVSAVKSGRIQVDGEMVPVSYIVKSSQKISHFVHRHEPPVMAFEVTILQKEVDVLTVCKPASVPVHPCGQYRKNTVLGILQAEHGLAPLFPIHRLDRLVSGLLILARNAPKADTFRQQIEAGLVQKEYIAKVVGEFPDREQIVDANINYNAREGRSTAEVGASSEGKTACTKFTRISSNGTYSIVLCKPISGRTHQLCSGHKMPFDLTWQNSEAFDMAHSPKIWHPYGVTSASLLIRVHLQHMGHPIANDMLYLSENTIERSDEGLSADRAIVDSDCSLTSNLDEKYLNKYEDNSIDDFSIDPMCTNCPNLSPKGYGGQEEDLWLHCFRYSGPGWMYECPYPDWA